jgi:colanic acid biosynthesis glycosyl transferase WcaI
MRIILINQFFWPDAAATSQYLTDLARFLVAQGHEVEVVCGRSSYAGTNDTDPEPPVVIRRTPCSPFTRGMAGRMCSYVSFFLGAFWLGLRTPSADMVITLTTPPMLPILGAVLKKLRHKKHFIWEMDLFPEALADVGLLGPNSWIVRLLGEIADWSRRQSDGIISLGDCMRQRLLDRGIPASKIHVAENWADGAAIFPLPLRRNGPLTILYSGNLGLPHDIDTIRYAMRILKTDSHFHFRFVGGGRKRKALSDFCDANQIANASFAPYCRRDEMLMNLAAGDVGLVTQRAACAGTVVPSKTYALMAAGRPVLYIGPRESTPGRIVRRFRCGWQVDCGDGPALVALLKDLEADRGIIAAAGIRARDAFLNHYDLPQGVARICDIIGVPVYIPAARMAGVSG